VAIATVISQTFSAVAVIASLMKCNNECKLFLKELKIYKKELLDVLRVGLPAGLQSSLFSISNVLIQSTINSFGVCAVQGGAAQANIDAFIYTAMNAFSQTAINFESQCMGATDYKRAKKSIRLCVAAVAVTGLTLSGIVYLFEKPLLKLYLPNLLEDEFFYARERLFGITIFYFGCGIQEVLTSGLRGIGKQMTPMLISIFFVCVFRIFWIFCILPLNRTFFMLFLSYPVSYALAIIADYVAYRIYFGRIEKVKITA